MALRQDVKSSQSLRSINLEVVAVDSEDAPDSLALGNPDQGGIRQIHRQVPILPHELAHTGTVFVPELYKVQTTDVYHVPQCALGLCGRPKQVHCFGIGRPNGTQRVTDGAKRLAADLVIGVAAVNKRDERAGVDQDVGHAFSLAAVERSARRYARTSAFRHCPSIRSGGSSFRRAQERAAERRACAGFRAPGARGRTWCGRSGVRGAQGRRRFPGRP